MEAKTEKNNTIRVCNLRSINREHIVVLNALRERPNFIAQADRHI
jgi:hypothetical protein